MMRTIPFVFLLISMLCACSKNNGPASDPGCPDWYEGPNCQTPMRQKWIGTFVGTTHIGANVNGQPDTFTFVPDPDRIDYDHCSNKNFDLSIRNTREASIPGGFLWGTPFGVGIVSGDGKYASLSYTWITSHSGLFDPYDTTFYTFTGTKQ